MDGRYSYLISLMTWSFSRLRSFEDCRYGFFLRYIYEEEQQEHFYSVYGSLMHRILERFYSGKISQDEASDIFTAQFLLDIPNEVKPGIAEKYYEQGKRYLSALATPQEKIIGVEEKLKFNIDGHPFVGYADLILRDDDGLIIQDHKTHILQGKSTVKLDKKSSKTADEFDEYAKQLYLYAIGTEQKFGELPAKIRFNCFRNGTQPEEVFDKEKYKRAIDWAITTIGMIEQESKWEPSPEWFKCKYICSFSDRCEFAGLL